MPKKTKREKILAEVHRKTTITAPAYVFVPPDGQKQTMTPTDAVEYTAIKRDLVKTLVLAAMALTTEFLLYFQIGRG